MSTRRVVYTVLMGGYESLLEQPWAGGQGTDLICFTDNPELTSETWQVQHVEPVIPADSNRSSRRPKILAHEYLADYEESLYIDNTVLLTAPAEVAFDQMLPSAAPMALARHSFRGSVGEEFEAVVEHDLDDEWVVTEQLGHYESVAPHILAGPALWGGILARRHNEPGVRCAMQTWWEHVLRYSRRDQLSLPLALEAAGLEPLVHDLDNRRSTFHEWPSDGVIRERRRVPSALQQVAALQKEVAALEGELLAIRSSISWRMTDPARRTVDFINGLRAITRATSRARHRGTHGQSERHPES